MIEKEQVSGTSYLLSLEVSEAAQCRVNIFEQKLHCVSKTSRLWLAVNKITLAHVNGFV